MQKSTSKKLFLWGTLISTIIFLALTYDTLKQIPDRTNAGDLTPEVAAGKWVWQRHNCNDCHTILGIGGYYAPDLTKEGALRSADWLKEFLKDPRKVMPATSIGAMKPMMFVPLKLMFFVILPLFLFIYAVSIVTLKSASAMSLPYTSLYFLMRLFFMASAKPSSHGRR